MKPEDLSAVRDAAVLGSVMPLIQAELDKMNRQLEQKMQAALAKGTMTPEMALTGWIEKASLHRLHLMLMQKVRMGQSKGENLASELDINPK